MKSFFTQSACVLLREPVSLLDVDAALEAFDKAGFQEASVEGGVWLGTPAVLLHSKLPGGERQPGDVVVDVIDRPWPDEMADPTRDPELFAAWSMGCLGPHVTPGCLTRAVQQSGHWPDARAAVADHRAFIRIRTRRPAEDHVAPDPLQELKVITAAVQALLSLSVQALPGVELPGAGAICCFNPNGERLLTRDALAARLDLASQHQREPLDVWTNVRLIKLDQDAPGWLLADTVGMAQLDAADHEACMPVDRFEPADVVAFLRNAAWYTFSRRTTINAGDTMPGPAGSTWRAFLPGASLVPPSRPVVRWLPVDVTEPPAALVTSG